MPYLLILLAIAARLAPHPLNLTPIGALGLFAGAHCRPAVAWLVPLLAMLVGDAVTGFYHPVIMAGVYLGFLGGPVISGWLLRSCATGGRRTLPRFATAILSSATFFFVVSNFAMWLSGVSYPLTGKGLVECYVNAIPYFGRSLAGDTLYAVILFGGYELARRWLARGRDASVRA